MLAWSAGVLSAGVVFGLVLIILLNTAPSQARVWWPGLVHAGLGAAGFALLAAGVALSAPRGVQQGAGSFGAVAAGLVAGGLVLGGLMLASRLRGRRPALMLLGVHATLGVAGLVMLAVYLSV